MKLRVAAEQEFDLMAIPAVDWPKEAKELAMLITSEQLKQLQYWIKAGNARMAKSWLVEFIEQEYRKQTSLLHKDLWDLEN